MKRIFLAFWMRSLASKLFTVGLLIGFVAITTTTCRTQQVYWPTKAWRTSSPEAQGIDSTVLADALDYVRQHHLAIHSLLIVRNGYIVLDAYFYPFAPGERHDIASATKSITSTMIGISIGKGQLHGVTQPVLSVFPNARVASRDERKDKLTLEHMLTMTSGLDCQFSSGEVTLREMRQSANWVQFVLDRPMVYAPGEHYEYCSPGMHLLSGVLSQVSGGSALDFARRELFTPLGITDVVWPSDGSGVTYGWGDLQLQPRDMAKIGYLWLNRGRWEGKQIVPADYLRAATQVQSHAPWGEDYGYGFWVYPQVAGGLFEANGRGGQRISVVADKNIVVVMTGEGFEPGEIGKFLLAAIKSDQALPDNRSAATRLNSLVTAALDEPTPSAHGHATRPVSTVHQVSGKVYEVGSNPWNLRSFRIDFAVDSAPVLQLNFTDSRSVTSSMVMDGAPKLSGSGVDRVLVSASFEDANTLLVDYDQIAKINHIQLRLGFAGKTVKIHLVEKTSGDMVEFSGQQR